MEFSNHTVFNSSHKRIKKSPINCCFSAENGKIVKLKWKIHSFDRKMEYLLKVCWMTTAWCDNGPQK